MEAELLFRINPRREVMLKKIFTILIFTFLMLSGCNNQNNNDEYKEQILNDPVKQFESYSFNNESSLIDRITDTPEFVLDYLKNMDSVDNYTSYSLSESERIMFEEYINLLPDLNRKIMEEKLIAIYFVNNLYGSALADYAVKNNKEIFNILIINPEVFKHSMTEWITYRENSCFDGNTDIISVDCGEKYTGLLYTLLHESTHLVDYNLNITPFAEYGSFLVSGKEFDSDNIFVRTIWKNYHQVKPRYNRSFMKMVTFYGLNGGPYLEISEAEKVYQKMMKSPFCSLYSSMSWAEDLAELTTWYYYTQILNQPYTISIRGEEGLISFSPLENEKVIERLKIVESTIMEAN
jgi:hypothetical protein